MSGPVTVTLHLNAGDGTRIQSYREGDVCLPLCDIKCGGMTGRTVAEGERITAEIVARYNAAPELLEALEAAAALATCCMAQGCYSHDELSAMARATRPKFEAALARAKAPSDAGGV